MDPDLDVRSAGLDPDAVHPLSTEDLQWADIIFVMEKSHRNKLTRKFKPFLGGKRLICLNIPDVYPFMDPELIERLKASVPRYLKQTN